jgi:hypothetical protein
MFDINLRVPRPRNKTSSPEFEGSKPFPLGAATVETSIIRLHCIRQMHTNQDRQRNVTRAQCRIGELAELRP